MQQYLSSSEHIDWQHPLVTARATELSKGLHSDEAIAQKCFEFVRDSIKHSWDYRMNPVTCKASDVLIHATGYCYAKSHLLAALLRANRIPAGMCYQRLSLSSDSNSYCLHGLNAVYLQQHGWYRIDSRGNKLGVSAEFKPPTEQLAFPIVRTGERDFSEIWTEPLPQVIKILTQYNTVAEVYDNLPDIEVI